MQSHENFADTAAAGRQSHTNVCALSPRKHAFVQTEHETLGSSLEPEVNDFV